MVYTVELSLVIIIGERRLLMDGRGRFRLPWVCMGGARWLGFLMVG